MPRPRAALPAEPPAGAPSPRASKPREAVSPSMGLALADLGVLLLMLGLTFLLGVFPQNDTDFWWHLRTGDLIRNGWGIPTTDWYTFGAAGHDWIDLHWLFQVGLSVLYAAGGVNATIAAKCVITTLAVMLLLTARRRDWPVWVMVLAWLPALLLLSGRMYVRPETMTLLYLAADLAILFRIDRRPWLAWGLPVVQLLWVNTQGLFVFGPILVGAALIDAALRRGAFSAERRRWWRTVLGASLATGLACLVNPYGLWGALYPLELARTMSSPVFSGIQELQSIREFVERTGLRSLPLQIHLVVLALGGLSFVVPIVWRVIDRANNPPEPVDPKKKPKRRKADDLPPEPLWRLSPFRFLLFAAFSALSMTATRNSHQFAAVVGTVTAWNFGEWAAALNRRRAEREGRRAKPSALPIAPRLAVGAIVAAIIGLVASGQFYAWAGEGRTVGWGERPLWFAHEASKFAGSEGMPERFLVYHNGLAGLFEYDNGPKRKVFADARLEVMGPVVYEQDRELAAEISSARPNATDRILRLGSPTPGVLVDHTQPIMVETAASMLAAQGWRCVFHDETGSVYVHNGSGFRGETVDFAARHFGVRADPVARNAAARLMAAQALAFQSGGVLRRNPFGLRRMVEGMGALAESYARKVRVVEPGSAPAWRVMGQVENLRALMRSPDTAPRYRLPFDPTVDIPFARATHDWAEADRLIPDDFMTLVGLFQVYAEREMYEEANAVADRLLSLPATGDRPTMLRRLAPEIGRARAAMKTSTKTSWSNLGELEQALTRLESDGRARSAADLIESSYKPKERTWEQADRLATLRLHLGRPDLAREAWLSASEPPRPALRDARVAVTHLVQGDFEAARKLYRAALKAEPDLFEAHYGLAVIERDSGHAAEALASARSAEKTAGSDAARAAASEIAQLAAPYVRTASDEK